MIELDLFGSWGKYFIEQWKEAECGSWKSVLEEYYHSWVPVIKLEDIGEIPRELSEKEFAGRISFGDVDTETVQEMFCKTGYFESRNSVNDGYEVFSGYFPIHLPYISTSTPFGDLDWGDDFGDAPNIADEVERCKNNEE